MVNLRYVRILQVLIIASSFLMADADLDSLRTRLKKYYVASISTDSALEIMHLQNADGSWSSINYNTSKGAWPSKHLNNLNVMSAAYYEENFLLQKDSLKSAVLRGLNYWYSFEPALRCKNWWVNDIGNQLDLNPVAIMMWDDLPLTLKEKLIGNNQEKPSMTATNEAWISANVVVRGILEQNKYRVQLGIDGIAHSISITDGEGQQIDHSFFQHGNLLYNGGYGKVALSIACLWANLSRGTSFAFSPKQIVAMAGLALDGDQWLVWGKTMDVLTIGREISRPNRSDGALSLVGTLNNLMSVDSTRKMEYQRFIAHINGLNGVSLLGCKYFWRGEMLVKRLPSFYSSLKISSDATVSSEFVNNENKKGYWLGMGVNMFYHRWDDYADIYPIWDWSKLPGVTNFSEVPLMPPRMKNSSHFAGGVSNGNDGVAAMIVDLPQIQANKSWFFFGNRILALGSGIKSDSHSEVTTAVDQRLSRFETYSATGLLPEGFEENAGKKLWYDSIGYESLDNQSFFVSNRIQNGRWRDIGTVRDSALGKKVLKIWINHGLAPKAGKYSYLIGLGVDSLRFWNGVSKLKILSNDTNAQSVYDPVTNSLAAVFYKPGHLSFLKASQIEVNSPCVLMLRESNGKFHLDIADPLRSVSEIYVKVLKKRSDGKTLVSLLRVEMPSGVYAGSTASVDFVLNNSL